MAECKTLRIAGWDSDAGKTWSWAYTMKPPPFTRRLDCTPLAEAEIKAATDLYVPVTWPAREGKPHWLLWGEVEGLGVGHYLVPRVEGGICPYCSYPLVGKPETWDCPACGENPNSDVPRGGEDD